MKKILFVCTGNTCRSPMAEAILNNKQHPTFTAKSAGVFAPSGLNASPYAIEVLTEKGIKHQHLSSPLTENALEWATHILTMTNNHKEMIMSQYPFVASKTYTLKEFVHGENHDISDPYGGSKEMYRQTLIELEGLIDELINKEENK